MIHILARAFSECLRPTKIVTLTILVTGVGVGAEGRPGEQRTEVTYRMFGQVIRAARLNDFEYPFIPFTAPAVALVVHASPHWDSENWVRPAVLEAVPKLRAAGVPILTLASREERASASFEAFLGSIGPSTVLPFEGDSHRIVFTGRRAFVMGGNFTECACDAVRSLIALSNASLRIDFVTRAIYEIANPTTLPAARLDPIAHSEIRSRRLRDLLDAMSDREMLAYLAADYIAPDTLPCPTFTTPFVTRPERYQYRVYRESRFVGPIGDSGRVIELHFD